MKSTQKILIKFFVSIVLGIIISMNSVIVLGYDDYDGHDTAGAGTAYSTPMSVIGQLNADTSDSSGATSGLKSVVERLLGFLQIASALIAVVMIAVTGFRYIIETPEMKNELKKSMIPIIVGILLVFFATSIAKFFIGMFSAK